MDSARLQERLLATFTAEMETHLRAFERDLLALERCDDVEGRAALFTTLFRTAHSLKGAARAVGLTEIESVAHWQEEMFQEARDGDLPVDASFFQILLPAVDALKDAARRLRAKEALTSAPILACTRRPAAPSVEMGRAEVQIESGAGIDSVRVSSAHLDNLLRRSDDLLALAHKAKVRAQEAKALCRSATRLRQRARDVAREGYDGAPSLMRLSEEAMAVEDSVIRLAADLRSDRLSIEQTARPLHDAIRRTRMSPFTEACVGLERMVRDLAANGKKSVRVIIEGSDVEVDRAVLEGLRDPLVHLVRNAVDHGIEQEAERRASGKPGTGTIRLAAAVKGERVEISVADDGRGIDPVAIRKRLSELGRPVPDNDAALVRSIFLPGLSTARAVTEISGRGIGLDVVKARLDALLGRIDVAYETGRGTRMTLLVPLTLSSLRVLLVETGDRIYALDIASVRRVLRAGREEIRSAQGRDMLIVNDVPTPIIALDGLLGHGKPALATEANAKFPFVVIGAGDLSLALMVDGFVGEREIMVHPLGPRLRKLRFGASCSVLPDGRVALLLDSATLVSVAAGTQVGPHVSRLLDAMPEIRRQRLLVVDDSLTIRTLEKSLLEAAGYSVAVAEDGAEAWRLMQDGGIDLVVSDVEMPNMDGFTLTRTIRASHQFQDLPVILVTALESDADKARGLAAGADAYCLKSAFDHKELLTTISRIL